jgi:hypothetical protein
MACPILAIGAIVYRVRYNIAKIGASAMVYTVKWGTDFSKHFFDAAERMDRETCPIRQNFGELVSLVAIGMLNIEKVDAMDCAKGSETLYLENALNFGGKFKPIDFAAFRDGYRINHLTDENPHDRNDCETQWLAWELGRKYAIQEFREWRNSRSFIRQ